MVMIVFVTACIGRCRRNSVERRTWLGLGGVGTVVVSGIAAYGVCAGFGKGRVAWFLPGGNRVSRQHVTTAPFLECACPPTIVVSADRLSDKFFTQSLLLSRPTFDTCSDSGTVKVFFASAGE